MRAHFFQVPHRPTFTVVHHIQYDRLVGGGNSCNVNHVARKLGGISCNEGLHVAVVAGVQLSQGAHGIEFALVFGIPKTDAARMTHKGVERVQVHPSSVLRTDTKIIFFAIALAKMRFIKSANFLQASLADEHAKPNTRRNCDVLPCQVL